MSSTHSFNRSLIFSKFFVVNWIDWDAFEIFINCFGKFSSNLYESEENTDDCVLSDPFDRAYYLKILILKIKRLFEINFTNSFCANLHVIASCQIIC